MIIAISGLHGTGKTTVARKVAEQMDMGYYSTGQMFRDIAKERGLSLEELSKQAEESTEIDFEIDNRIKAYALKGNCILDNQLSPYLLGDIVDYCVLLKCAKDVRLARMADRDSDNFEAKVRETEVREKSEHERFIKYYNVDILNANIILGTFDLIVDATYLDIDGVTRVVINGIKEFKRVKSIK